MSVSANRESQLVKVTSRTEINLVEKIEHNRPALAESGFCILVCFLNLRLLFLIELEAFKLFMCGVEDVVLVEGHRRIGAAFDFATFREHEVDQVGTGEDQVPVGEL